MKKIFTPVLFWLISQVCYGQSNTFPLNGNVGIGTNNPQYKLDINGVLQLYNRDAASATWDNIRIWAEGGSSVIESNGDEDGLILRSNYGGKILLMSNVGIGTLSPSEKLSVNGKIRAKEIKVENANWPDFVFAKSYGLPTLKETEKHIKEKGHLPGIPSAEEVKANGVDLGDMNAKLLQKIEELTLYLIEQNRKIERQALELVDQKKLINKLIRDK